MNHLLDCLWRSKKIKRLLDCSWRSKKALAHELTDVVELYIKTQIYMMLQQLCLLNEL